MVTTTKPRLARSCTSVVPKVRGSPAPGEYSTTGNGARCRATGAPWWPLVSVSAQSTRPGGTR